MATGSLLAKIPTFETSGMSLPGSQSQKGETSMANEMWKAGFPSRTAFAYSAIFLFIMGFASSHLHSMAPFGQKAKQCPHPRHLFSSITAFLLIMFTPELAQFLTHIPQPMQRSSLMAGVPLLCISILPFFEPHPMPMFLMAPPKPATM